eukprot:CAMPEP_0114565632 /NCGR_PEP_ID=MMETSP0114-20121206/14416_1 /TAXON_ID=31324 /ORGANISM="Goniomonas sp, Strain m" /LENGTH=101 /DNA_ID=CAMNT_0001751897 /DNA_START=423 /DNA_END=729 /DNA_ORIENTATION=+
MVLAGGKNSKIRVWSSKVQLSHLSNPDPELVGVANGHRSTRSQTGFGAGGGALTFGLKKVLVGPAAARRFEPHPGGQQVLRFSKQPGREGIVRECFEVNTP